MRQSATDPAFLTRLEAALPQARIDDSAPYFSEPRGRWMGQGVVVAPASTDEVARLVRLCAEAQVGIVPHAGGTGLVSGQVAPEGPAPLVLSVARLNQIGAVDLRAGVVEVGAGAILADIQNAAAAVGRLFPLSLASEGSARIGGLLATNAGGVNVLRYGNARALCLGLEVVTADGGVWNGLKGLRKDNTGYDLRDLMIGAEGTLGIITAASLRLVPDPARKGTALMAVDSPAAALDLLAMAQMQMGDGVSAFELIHRQGPDFLAEAGPETRMPFDPMPDWMVLVDIGLPDGADPDAALEALFAAGHAAGLVDDGVIARSEADRRDLWALRERIPEANRRIGSISSHDISLPLSAIPDFIATAPAEIARLGAFRINCFGHLGDGNLHYNVFPQPGSAGADEALRGQIKRAVHDHVARYGGSFSAEHGVGRAKVADLERYGDATGLMMMRAIKRALDPLGIMNPGAVLREEA